MITYVLVFWLIYPENSTVHTEYKTLAECQQNAEVWNWRLQKVKSQLVAECRRQER